MNTQYGPGPASTLRTDRRRRFAAAAVLLILAACAAVLTLALPSVAQDRQPSAPTATPAPIYVDADATGAGNGTSWEDAFTTIHDALSGISSGELWVAEGVYYPDEGGSQIPNVPTEAFHLEQGVSLYGGFDPSVGDDTWEERDPVNHVTVLSGDIGQDDDTSDGVVTDPIDGIHGINSYHVVIAQDVMKGVELDGFTITGGLADSDTYEVHCQGAGIYGLRAMPMLANLIIRGNKAACTVLEETEGYGAGMYMDDSSPEFTNVTFRDNYAGSSGGGLYANDSGGSTDDLTFLNNQAGTSGGGMYIVTSVGNDWSNLTFTGNSAGESGGGLYVQSTALSKLDNSTFESNTTARGGGLYLNGSLFELKSTLIKSNIATEWGGGMFVQLSTHSLNNVTFDLNHAGAAGGGLYADTNNTDLNASSFTGNTSVLGAAIYVDDHSSEVTQLSASDTWFIDNVADQDGGGLYVVNSLAGSLTGLSLISNDATTGSGGGMFLGASGPYALSGTEFDSNQAMSGGGMYVQVSEPTLTEVTFHSNQATGGGGIYLADGSDATFSATTFTANLATTGGGIYIDDSDPGLTNIAFRGNQADGGSGGGLWNDAGMPTLRGVLFSGNTATLNGGGMCSGGSGSNVTITNATMSGNVAGGSGGGLYTTSPNMLIYNTVIWNNEDSTGSGTAGASLTGAAELHYSLIQNQNPGGDNLNGSDPDNDPQFVVPVDLASVPTTSGILSVKYLSPIVDEGYENPVIAGVTEDLDGNPRIYNGIIDLGAYELPLACPPLETARLYVDHSKSLGNGGTTWADALQNLRDALTLAENCEGNLIDEVWVVKGVYRPDQGVGMVPDSRTETYQLIDGVAIYGGFAGGEETLIERDPVSNVTILSGDVDSNDIATGGVVQSPANIRGANSYHVVVASEVGNTTILDGFTITAGQANGAEADQTDGAGLHNYDASTTLANLIFIGNTAVNGGGIANVNGSNAPLANVQFKSNTASSSGGALYNLDSSPTLTNTILTGNSASSGAALYNQAASPTLTNTIMSGNSATIGAAIYNDASAPTLTNALLSGNYASSKGAALYNTASSPVLINVTVAGNRANVTAGGMFNTLNSHPIVRNTIFWDNRDATGTGTASATIYNDDPDYSEPLIEYSLVQALSGINYTGDHNLSLNPWFTAPLNPLLAPTTSGDYTLGIFSAAIDAGNNAYNPIGTDLAGDPRLINTIIDLGPYEAPYVPIFHIYLPAILRDYP